MLVTLWVRDNANGYAPFIKHTGGIDSDASSNVAHEFAPYFKITEKSDIWIQGTNQSGSATADCSAGFSSDASAKSDLFQPNAFITTSMVAR